MQIEDISFEEFIENFDNYFKNFILRLRDYEKDYNSNSDKESLAYYNGIKAFVVKKNKKGFTLNFPINVYKLNPTGLNNAQNKGKKNSEEILIAKEIEDFQEGETREQKEANYRSNIGNICNAMHKLFDFEMSKITFDINFKKTGQDKANYKAKIIKKFYKLLICNFANYVKSYNKAQSLDNSPLFKITNNQNTAIIYSNISELELQNICAEFYDKVSFTLEFTPKLTTNSKARNSTPKDIIILQCWFLRGARDIGRVSKVNFQVATFYRFKKYNYKTSLEKFAATTKKAIESYKSTSCEKLEKSYQHFFMLRSPEMKDLFAIKEDEYVDYFEQEYGIYNPKIYGSNNFDADKKVDKTGRIDCIVYKYKLENNQRVITDIYMIELKVNCDVILGDNGVMTHLEDINAFLNFKSQDKYQYYDYTTLEKRINDRIKILSGGTTTASFANVTKHFYTIIGYTKKTEIDIIKGMLKSLNTEDNVKKLIKDGYPKEENGEKYKLAPRFEGTTLYNLKQEIKDCDIKFFLEKNIFDEKTIGLDFIDITNELFENKSYN